VDVGTIKQQIPESWKAFETLFYNSLSARYELMKEIINYSIKRTGKQVRPLLGLLLAHALTAEEDNTGRGGAVNDSAIRCAVASEMIHTATLLHDDVADEANMRRGIPSVRSLYSPSASVLLGDFWLSRAVATLIETKNFDIFSCFARSIEDLAEGEMLEMQKTADLETSYDDYIRIIRHKTASLFEATAASSAYAVNAPAEMVNAAREYACHLGLSFQMRDDIFDYSPNLNTGKVPGSDLLEGKITLPLLGAFASSSKEETNRIKEKIRSLESESASETARDRNASIITEIYDFITEKGGIEYSNRILSEEAGKAVDALSVIPDSKYRQQLVSLAIYVGSRTI
jgi:octaprenyl-diphosphate synthase